MAKSSVVAKSFFGIIQQLYVLFSASVQRWQILKRHVKTMTLKPLFETRWECKVDSVKAVRYQIGDVCDALVEVSEITNDPKCHTEAVGLAKELKKFQFLVTLSLWYEILSHVNVVSKVMQSETCDLEASLRMIESVSNFFTNLREKGFEDCKIAARELADELEMDKEETVFRCSASLLRKVTKKQFSYEGNDESVHNPEQKYRIEFFNVLIDQAVASTNERFQQLKTYLHYFGFLCNISSLRNCGDKFLRQHCAELNSLLSVPEQLQSDDDDNEEPADGRQLHSSTSSDIEELNLFTELKTFANISPDQCTPVEALRYIYRNRLQDVFPNLATALRILLTIPVGVASAERSFSKLKLIKTYLRSTILQERLVGLAQISIENDIASSLDHNKLIDSFASSKTRRIPL